MLPSNNLISLMVWVAAVCVTAIYFWPSVRRELQSWILFYKIPGPSYILQIKTLWQFHYESESVTRTYKASIVPFFKKYPLIALGGGPIRTVWLCRAEAAKVLLCSKTQIEKSFVYKHFRIIAGDGVATSKGAKWYQRRKLLTPYFHFQMMRDYLEVMNNQTDILVRLLETKSKQIDGTAFNICPYITRCAMDIIGETAMNQRLNTQNETDSPYCNAVESIVHSMTRRNFNLWSWFDMIYRFIPMDKQESSAKEIIDGFADEVINNKLRQFAESKIANGPQNPLCIDVLGKKGRLAMLDMLVKMSMADSDSERLTEEDVRDEVKSFLFAGHDTAAINISWALYHIGRNPDIQQKMVDELNVVYGDSDRYSSSDDLNNLKYLECVIKESLRLHPPAALVGRHLTEEMSICGSTIPADSEVFASIYWVHRDPAHYPDPETFDPDRFLPENSQGRHPFAFIPFSAGVRNCLGQKFAMMEVKVILAAILRRFNVTALEQDPISNITSYFISNPCNGIWVQLDSRKTYNSK